MWDFAGGYGRFDECWDHGQTARTVHVLLEQSLLGQAIDGSVNIITLL
jgi:hypothetical protein